MGIFDRVMGGNILYYPGCLTKFAAPELEENYKRVLEGIGIDFIMLKDIELCCGSPVLNAGFVGEFNKLVERNKKLFDEHSIKRIVTNCPGCFHIFSKHYGIKAEHISVLLWERINRLKIRKRFNEDITYHDPCHLGRHSGIYDEPSKVLEYLGFHVVEMARSREDAFCCGGGAGLRTNKAEVADAVAKKRIEQAKMTNAKKLVTTCPMCYKHMKENAHGIEVLEFSQVILDAME
jgi:Fe-S oxidoreductase